MKTDAATGAACRKKAIQATGRREARPRNPQCPPGLSLGQPNHLAKEKSPSFCHGCRTLALVTEEFDSVLLVRCTTDPATGIEFATVSRVRFIKAAWLARSFGCGGRMIGPANVPLEGHGP